MPKIKKKKVKTKSLENLLAYKSKKGIVQIEPKTSEKFPDIRLHQVLQIKFLMMHFVFQIPILNFF